LSHDGAGGFAGGVDHDDIAVLPAILTGDKSGAGIDALQGAGFIKITILLA